MTALEILQAKTSVSNIPVESLLLAINEVEQAIKNYCNIEEVPPELNYTWANMAMDLALYQYEIDNPVIGAIDESIDSSDVSSIKIGDTSIDLKGNSGNSSRARALKSHRPNLDGILMNYQSQLKSFRRMVW